MSSDWSVTLESETIVHADSDVHLNSVTLLGLVQLLQHPPGLDQLEGGGCVTVLIVDLETGAAGVDVEGSEGSTILTDLQTEVDHLDVEQLWMNLPRPE